MTGPSSLPAGHKSHTVGTCLFTEVLRPRLEHKVCGMNMRKSGAGKSSIYPGLGCWASRSACCLLWPEVAPSLLGAERLTEGQMPPHSEAEPGHVPKKSDPVSRPPLHMGTLLPESVWGTGPSSAPPQLCHSLHVLLLIHGLTKPTEALGSPLHIPSNLVFWIAHSKCLNN